MTSQAWLLILSTAGVIICFVVLLVSIAKGVL